VESIFLGSPRRSSITSSINPLNSKPTSKSALSKPFQKIIGPLRSFNIKYTLWTRQSRFHGWRMGLLFGCSMSTFVLCCNIAMMVVGAIRNYDESGIANLITGDEAKISRWNTGLHVIINALSTMLLSASNYTTQVLSSPTRKDVDGAHKKGQWLTIGLLSPRNLRAIPLKRRLLWLTMASSSIPLHLL
jgi:hypothetical protein